MKDYKNPLFFFIFLLINANLLTRAAIEREVKPFFQPDKYNLLTLENTSGKAFFCVIVCKNRHETEFFTDLCDDKETIERVFPKGVVILFLWENLENGEVIEKIKKTIQEKINSGIELDENQINFHKDPTITFQLDNPNKDMHLELTQENQLKPQKRSEYRLNNNVTKGEIKKVKRFSQEDSRGGKGISKVSSVRDIFRGRSKSVIREHSTQEFENEHQKQEVEKLFELINKDKIGIFVGAANGKSSVVKLLKKNEELSKNNTDFDYQRSTNLFIWLMDGEREGFSMDKLIRVIGEDNQIKLIEDNANKSVNELNFRLTCPNFTQEFEPEEASSVSLNFEPDYFISLPKDHLQYLEWCGRGLRRKKIKKTGRINDLKNVTQKYIEENLLRRTDNGFVNASAATTLDEFAELMA